MTPRQIALYLGIALALIGTGVWIGASSAARHYSKKAEAAQAQADQHEGAAQTHAAQAAESDRQGAANRAAVLSADAKVQAAKRELAALKARLPKPAPVSISVGDTPSPTGSSPEIPDSSTAQVIAERDAYKAAYEQALAVIAEQDKRDAAKTLQISIEHASAVQWHQAYDEAEKTVALERISKDAAIHAEHASGVKGQLIRGFEGLAIGYVAGKVTR